VELEISWGLGDCLPFLFGLNDEDFAQRDIFFELH